MYTIPSCAERLGQSVRAQTAPTAVMLCFAVVALSVPARASDTATLTAGTVIPVKLAADLSSSTAQKGDHFIANVDTSGGDYYRSLPDGTTVSGTVRGVQPMQDKNPGMLELSFDELDYPNGRKIPIQASLIGLDNASVDKDSSGRLTAKPKHKTDRLTYVGYGAAGGLILGLLTHKPLETLILGGGLGYLYGALEKSDRTPREVDLKAGQAMGVRLDHDVSLVSNVGDYHVTDKGDTGTGRSADTGAGEAAVTSRAPGSIGVMLDATEITFGSGALPIEKPGSVILVPVKPVLAAAKLRYSVAGARSNVITVASAAGDVRASVDSRIVIVGGRRRLLKSPLRRIGGTLYGPSDYLAIVTGRAATWDADSRTVLLSSDAEAPSSAGSQPPR